MFKVFLTSHMQLEPGNDDDKFKFVVFEQQRYLCER